MSQPSVDRQVILRGWVKVRVKDPGSAPLEVENMATRVGGLVESSNRAGDNTIGLVFRIPADSLDMFLAQLGTLGDVERQNVSTNDVTDEIADLDARLANVIAVRDRLRGYLDRTSDLQDILAIERELTRVQTEIDSIAGRLERLRGQVAMSQVSVTLHRKRTLGPLGLVAVGTASVVERLFFLN